MSTAAKIHPGLQLLGLLLLARVAAVAAASPSAAPAAAEPKSYVLFMGAEVLAEHNKELYPVQDVVGGSFVVKIAGKDVKIPAEVGAVSLKVNRSLQLTDAAVLVDHLTVERAYTPGNDPAKKVQAAQSAMASQDSAGDIASKLVIAQSGGNLGFGHQGQLAGSPVNSGPSASPNVDVSAAERNFNGGGAAAVMDNSVRLIENLQSQSGAELFDAVDIACKVSSKKPIRKPYLIVMAQYHDPAGKPGETQNWIYAAALEPLDSRPQKVSVRKGGFPPGYVLDKYQVHLYDGGRELGTNVADKQVQLTRNDAFTYLSIDYVGSHKGATLPATPALGPPDADAKSRLRPEQLNRTYYVKVSKDGLPVAAFTDAACVSPADETVGALIAGVRFYPALEKGKPVEGVAELALNRLGL